MSNLLVSDEEYFDEYKSAWEKCGVTCVSRTMGAIHEQPYSLEAAYHNFACITHMLDYQPELGTSFTQRIEGFEDYTLFPNLLAGLARRGYTASKIERLAGRNFLSVFRNVVE
jgi:microsomal dipeptidase-like Zn-dependent dipeptidase